MHLRWVELRDFRNHEQTRLDVPDGLVVASGANGEGKTNLLEGMNYLFALASPRVAHNAALVRRGTGAAYSRGEVETRGGRVLVEVEIPLTGASRVHVNRSPLRRKRELRKQIRAVFFAPEDLDVVRGDPGQRRRFMDEAVVSLTPVRESALRAYERTLRQRNRLLKDWEGRGEPPELDAWDEELVEHGVAVSGARAEAVGRLVPLATERFRWLAGYELTIRYAPSVAGDPPEDAFRARLAERRGDEIVRRTSLVGPHRDDLEIEIRELGARALGSHGEAWAAALCLRLGLADAVGAEVGEPPVILLDDPFSALDPVRRARVAEHLPGRGQVVVSVADEAHLPPGAAAVWDVRAGDVTVREARGPA